VFLDGRELGRGSDWRTVSAYDLSWLLPAGPHVLAVDGFNDVNKAGIIVGFHAELSDGRSIDIRSDTNWLVAPLSVPDWRTRRQAPASWPHATVVGVLGESPWWQPLPTEFANVPPMFPLTVHFWERGWFQITLLAVCGLAVLTSARLMTQLAVQSRARRLLQLERARIARDIHDDLGARLTTLLVTGEEAQSKLPGESEAHAQFGQMCDGTRELLNAIDEVVWVVNPQRDTLNDSVIYICKYAESFLRAASVRCRFDIQRDLPEISLELPFRRNIFLAIKESLRNAVKHSGGTEVSIRIRLNGPMLTAVVEDNGLGFDVSQVNLARHGLTNMATRMKDVGGSCYVDSAPGTGCRVEFKVPLLMTRPHRSVVKSWFGQPFG
jgi:signal transduction histidine kinase